MAAILLRCVAAGQISRTIHLQDLIGPAIAIFQIGFRKAQLHLRSSRLDARYPANQRSAPLLLLISRSQSPRPAKSRLRSCMWIVQLCIVQMRQANPLVSWHHASERADSRSPCDISGQISHEPSSVPRTRFPTEELVFSLELNIHGNCLGGS